MKYFHLLLVAFASTLVESFHVGMKVGHVSRDNNDMHSLSRRAAFKEFTKLASVSTILVQSLPADAKKLRSLSEKEKVVETREEREARIKKERAEYEERRRQIEV